MYERIRIGALGAAVTLAGSAYGQGINVTVDGEVIPFAGQPPVERSGSVLVPLRGVFERLGATVAFDGATKTIVAVKGPTSISLQIGSTQATVNGQPRALSQPAQAIRGTTLVPLRFVSEALGAQVKWSGATRTVIIATGGVPNAPNPGNVANPPTAGNAGDVRVTSLTHNARGPLRAGQTLQVTLQGTSGGTAAFTIPGIEQARSVPMRETSSGTYVGTLTMPTGITVKNAVVLATLKRGAQTAPMLQAGQPLTVDTVGPTLGSLSPVPNASVAPGRPLIYTTYSDAGSGVDPRKVRLFLNGKDITASATVTEAFISYVPAADLAPGRETINLAVRDNAGNETRRNWSFTVAAQESLIKSVRYAPETKALEPGDELTVTMTGRAGGTAKFSVGGTVTGRPMSERSAGTYVGSYTVKKGDSLAKAPVTVTLTVGGRTVTQSAEGAIDIAAGAPETPTITSPQDGASTGETVTLAGTARPGATVRYTIRYSGQLIVLPVSGAIADGEVKADSSGNWRVEGVRLSTPTGVTRLSYQVAAVTVSEAGEASEPATVDFKR
ncbi:MAG: copper amine oxidase N-terminal domain-containing protein [Capsulimonadales bacterium]|nr:copper amine oxidase N-terminal domain-containing protein [Capsulimonadales bacterium]